MNKNLEKIPENNLIPTFPNNSIQLEIQSGTYSANNSSAAKKIMRVLYRSKQYFPIDNNNKMTYI